MKKLSQYETKILVEALQDTLKKQMDNYVDNIREIKMMLDAEVKNFPPKLKGALHRYYSLLDEVQAKILALKSKSEDLLDDFPSIEAWSLNKVIVDAEAFQNLLQSQGIDTKYQRQGGLLLWDSDNLSIYAQRDPSKNGNMGKVFLVGNDKVVKSMVSQLKKIGDVSGEERDVAIPLSV